MKLIKRTIDQDEIQELIKSFPVVGLVGPRQCGKTTIAKQIGADHYFDLENPRDLAKLDQPQITLEDLKGLIIIDEIQRKPNLFPLIRYLVDTRKEQKYLILGSVSRDLLRQGSETLAGRIAYFYLEGFRITDIGKENLKKLWLRGGLPRSYLVETEWQSLTWREQYITTFLERDIPQLGITIPARTLRRFWTMLSHYHGQVINYSELGRSFGISDVTIRKYIDILEGTFMVRVLQPWYQNIQKRVVKRPKIYLKDSGIFHSLMAIDTIDKLLSHNKLGASWEGFALESVCRSLGLRSESLYFWGTHSGAEIDLFWQQRGSNWGVEFKYIDAPRLTKSMKSALSDLSLKHLWIIYPGKDHYKIAENLTVLPLENIPQKWEYP